MRQPRFTPRKLFWYSFLLEAECGPQCGWKDMVNWKKIVHLIGSRTRGCPCLCEGGGGHLAQAWECGYMSAMVSTESIIVWAKNLLMRSQSCVARCLPCWEGRTLIPRWPSARQNSTLTRNLETRPCLCLPTERETNIERMFTYVSNLSNNYSQIITRTGLWLHPVRGDPGVSE
jgi:hypothetical protein